MAQRIIHMGLPEVPTDHAQVAGGVVPWKGDTYYRLTDYDAMDPFLISVVGDADLWMYVSSNGGLAAGRGTAEQSLFPYDTVDKLHLCHHHTGPKTIFRCGGGENVFVWQPFSDDGRMRYELRRFLYKHTLGCELWFEEFNLSLGLTFRYGWRSSNEFGWVRTSELVNNGSEAREIIVLDGVQNVLPNGVKLELQQSASNLVDAYKSAECDPATGIAVFRLTADIIDRPEASEILRATTAWQSGMPGAMPILDGLCWDQFIRGKNITFKADHNGRRGSYLMKDDVELSAGEARHWHLVLNTPVDQSALVELRRALRQQNVEEALEADIGRGRGHLRRLLAGADALQSTADENATAHHVSNVLYNIARGGVLPNQYSVERVDFARFLNIRNRRVLEQHSDWLAALPASLSLQELHLGARSTGDTNLVRLCDEYLPIMFSRRHGDPSRPWNHFSIATKHPDGSQRYHYEGNWRDIFQNWEALCHSFPECIEPVIAKFVNATTVDGFNPYRVTEDGIDWEVPEPDNPWSSIGYWGDHQIVYLLKLLEASVAFHPGKLHELLTQSRFCFADVPYRIKPFGDILCDARNTIAIDPERQENVDRRVETIGSDGKLIHHDGEIVHASLGEKLLIPILAKLSNFVPGGGIWMNTMRPEWNDANNALVGNGLSLVTTCYLYRHLGFCTNLFCGVDQIELSSRVVDWLSAVTDAIRDHGHVSSDDMRRRSFLDAVGSAFSDYRSAVYTDGVGTPASIATDRIVALLGEARSLIGSTIDANRRSDGLYHAYNILRLPRNAAAVSHLQLMLEGQVAVLSSGSLPPEQAIELLGSLRTSELYRSDLNTYLLYPAKQLPDYLDLNRVPDIILERSQTLARMLAAGDQSIVGRDADGQLRFQADLHNADALRARLGEFPAAESEAILDTYEEVFHHRIFTGRSGTMYGYEGIGCVYWHMNAKLLLAVQENVEWADKAGAAGAIIDKLAYHYHDIRAGLGYMKSPAEFGAFPLDPYSHTPKFGGAKQPGMTGQVKEEILTRWGELGVKIEDGAITFSPRLLPSREYLSEPGVFEYIDVHASPRSIPLKPGSLAFTYCQVPIVYVRSPKPQLIIRMSDGTEKRANGNTLSRESARHVFERTGRIDMIVVQLPHAV